MERVSGHYMYVHYMIVGLRKCNCIHNCIALECLAILLQLLYTIDQ